MTLLRQALAQTIAVGGGPVALLGGLLIPTNKSHIADGVVDGVGHVRYHYDEGFLTLMRQGPFGDTEVLFHGPRNTEGHFISVDGDALARDMGRGVFIDGYAVRRLDTRTATIGHVQARPANDNGSIADNIVRFCPAPGPDRPGKASERAHDYQRHITGLPRHVAVTLNGVVFDGCDEARQVMLEAKGEGYEWALRGADFASWYWGRKTLIDQMSRQSKAAGDRVVEWHVAEERVAKVFKRLATVFPNIRVIWTLPPA